MAKKRKKKPEAHAHFSPETRKSLCPLLKPTKQEFCITDLDVNANYTTVHWYEITKQTVWHTHTQKGLCHAATITMTWISLQQWDRTLGWHASLVARHQVLRMYSPLCLTHKHEGAPVFNFHVHENYFNVKLSQEVCTLNTLSKPKLRWCGCRTWPLQEGEWWRARRKGAFIHATLHNLRD